MRPTYKLQLILIIVIAGLTAFIFIRGKDQTDALTKEDREVMKDTARQAPSGRAGASAGDFSLKAYKEQAVQNLNDSQRKRFTQLQSQLDKGILDSTTLPEMSHFWSHQDKPLIAASYHEKWAQQTRDTQTWYKVGEQYQKAGDKARDTAMRQFATNQAMEAFQKVLDENPDHLDAKAGLAIGYIQGKRQVMKGVGLLKEIVSVKPDHRKALFYLGILSIRSGQLEKALERFQKLTRIESGNAFNYFYLGTVQERMGNREQAIQAFKEYRDLVQQPKLKERARTKIKTLENK